MNTARMKVDATGDENMVTITFGTHSKVWAAVCYTAGEDTMLCYILEDQNIESPRAKMVQILADKGVEITEEDVVYGRYGSMDVYNYHWR